MSTQNERRRSFLKDSGSNGIHSSLTLSHNSSHDVEQLLLQIEQLKLTVARQDTQIRTLTAAASDSKDLNTDPSQSAKSKSLSEVEREYNSLQSLENGAQDTLSPLKVISPRKPSSIKKDRYSLNSPSRFASSDQILSPKTSSILRFEKNAEIIKADKDRTQKSSSLKKKRRELKHRRIKSLAEDVSALTKDIFGAAITQASTKCAALSDVKPSMHKAFDQFMLLSVSVDNFVSEPLKIMREKVHVHVDCGDFSTSVADSLDHFPAVKLSSWINPLDLSQFCFPNGVKFFVETKSKVHSSMAKTADRCHLLACTDDKGIMRQGVAVTFYEDTTANLSPSVIRKLYELRIQAFAALKLCKWWREISKERDRQKSDPFRKLKFMQRKPTTEDSDQETKSSLYTFKSPFKSPAGKMKGFRNRKPIDSTDSGIKDEDPPISKSKISIEEANKLFDIDSLKSLDHEFEKQADTLDADAKLSKAEMKTKYRKLAMESFNFMLESEVCFIPKCYVLIGGKPSESILQLAALFQMAKEERKASQSCRSVSLTSSICSPKIPTLRRTTSFSEIILDIEEDEAKANRQNLLKAMESDLVLPFGLAGIKMPISEFDCISSVRQCFQARLPFLENIPISFSLPLPQIANDWGVATLLRNLNPSDVLKIINLILLERSMIIIGKEFINVSSSIFALIEFLKPYDWAGTVIPLLPNTLYEILSSPVPFLVGVAGNSSSKIMEDESMTEAMKNGLSVVNLDEGYVVCTPEEETADILLHSCPLLLSSLVSLKLRLQELSQDPLSGLNSIEAFISRGLITEEALALRSARNAVHRYNSNFAADLIGAKGAYKKYGYVNKVTNEFEFFPSFFIEPRRSELLLQEKLVHTQLFVTFVSKVREKDLEMDSLLRERAGKKIALWLYTRWLISKRKKRAIKSRLMMLRKSTTCVMNSETT